MKGSFTLLILTLFVCPLSSTAQLDVYNVHSITPTVMNAASGSGTIGYYRFDWSVGEMSLIETYQQSNLVLENGFLHAGWPIGLPPINFFATGDIGIFPNPVYTVASINFNVPTPGRVAMKVTTTMGQPVLIREFDYNGAGRTEKIDLQGYPTGAYLVRITLQPNDYTAREITGVYKLIKITR
jgi:hypothetical protein